MSTQIVPEVLEYSGSIIASGQSLPFKVNSNAGIAFHCSGTFNSVNCTFEVSFDSTTGTDGTWIPVLAARNNANTGESTSGLLSAAPLYYWEAYIAGARWFRIRSTAWTSGVQNWKLSMCAIAQDPNPQVNVVGSATVAGSVTATPIAPTPYALNSLASTNLLAVKATVGSVVNLSVFNAGAAIAYLKLYNKATAPVLATDVPIMVIPVAAGALVTADFALGKRFSLGIAMATTGLAADTDATAVAAAQLKVTIDYL